MQQAVSADLGSIPVADLHDLSVLSLATAINYRGDPFKDSQACLLECTSHASLMTNVRFEF